MMRTQIPKFRLPEAVIDEEVGYVLDLGIEFRAGQRHRQHEGAARRGLRRGLRRQRRAARARPRRSGPHAKRRRTSISASTGCRRCRSATRQDRQARRRARRRQHGDGLLPQRAPPRRRGGAGRRALRLRRDEGVAVGEGGRDARGHSDPQLPRAEGVHARQRQAHRRHVREGRGAATTRTGSRELVPTGEPEVVFACDDVLVAVGQENAFPWIERDIGLEFDEWGMPVVDKVTMASTRPGVFFGGDARSARRTSSGRSRTATTPRSRSTSCCRGEDLRQRPPPTFLLIVAEDGHPRVELRQRDHAPTSATRCRSRTR